MQPSPQKIAEQISSLAYRLGLVDVGFTTVEDAPKGLEGTISIVAKLSDSVIDEIGNAPTHSYFHHYRTVNTFLDQAMLQIGFLLEQNGYRYLPVGASQSIHNGTDGFSGRYSHKKAACLCGLGSVGVSNLFLHRRYGPRVRLGTVFTNCLFEKSDLLPKNICDGCMRCRSACPAQAIKGKLWYPGVERFQLLDAAACSNHMKSAFQKIGRGAVCGICMRVCPAGNRVSLD